MKKGKYKRFKKKENKKDSNSSKLMIIFIAVIMLGTGLFYINRSQPETQQQLPDIPVDLYNVTPMGNSTAILRIANLTNDVIIFPNENSRLTLEIALNILNSTAEGIENVRLEQTNTYVMFVFETDGSDNATAAAERIAKREMGRYTLSRGFMASLPNPIPGIDSIYVIGEEDLDTGDYVRAYLLEKSRGMLSLGYVAFEETEVVKGPEINARVSNITEIVASGFFDSGLDETIVEENVPELFDTFIVPARVQVNSSLDNSTKEEIEAIGGLEIYGTGNQTHISFNNSLTEITEILDSENLNYSLVRGSLRFSLPANLTPERIQEIRNLLLQQELQEVELTKDAIVEIPRNILIGDDVVPVENYASFPVDILIDSVVGDEIWINLTYITVGENVILFDGTEFRRIVQ